jgi:hypothetical protein
MSPAAADLPFARGARRPLAGKGTAMSRFLVVSPVLVSVLVSVVALAGSACSASEAAAPAPASPATPATAQAQPASTDAKAVCVEVFTRNRTCTAQYIPALVDLRAKHDVPAGIAAEVAANRAAVIAQANEEWATDSTDAAIDATCTKIAAGLTAADQADFGGIGACLAQTDCGAYTACVMPYFEKRFAK